jgi:hypothetical protein
MYRNDEVVRLYPLHTNAAPHGRVIDVEFKLVSQPSFFGGIVKFLGALTLAALIGAMAPMAWMLIDSLVS